MIKSVVPELFLCVLVLFQLALGLLVLGPLLLLVARHQLQNLPQVLRPIFLWVCLQVLVALRKALPQHWNQLPRIFYQLQQHSLLSQTQHNYIPQICTQASLAQHILILLFGRIVLLQGTLAKRLKRLPNRALNFYGDRWRFGGQIRGSGHLNA